jgi:hypothetical protein
MFNRNAKNLNTYIEKRGSSLRRKEHTNLLKLCKINSMNSKKDNVFIV